MSDAQHRTVLKSLVKKILEQPYDQEWSVQGLGMMRLYLDDNRRLHIWDDRLKVENVSVMHTHPWNFRSYVVAGVVNNERFVTPIVDPHVADTGCKVYHRQSIFCGVGGGLEGSPDEVLLGSAGVETYTERETYHELAHEIHVSNPDRGTITSIKREPLADADHAYVYWEEGEWVSAEPRSATKEEIKFVTEYSLGRWFS